MNQTKKIKRIDKMNCVPELFQSMASTSRNRLGWLFLHGNSVKGTSVQPRGQHCSDLTVRGERRQKDQQVSTVQLLPPVRPDNWRGYLMSAAVYCFVSLIFVWTDDHRSWWPQTATWVSFTMLVSDRHCITIVTYFSCFGILSECLREEMDDWRLVKIIQFMS